MGFRMNPRASFITVRPQRGCPCCSAAQGFVVTQPAQRPAPPSSCWGLWWELFTTSPRLLLLLALGLGCANPVTVFAK